MEERKVELVVSSTSESFSDRTKLLAHSDEGEVVVGCVDPRLRIQDSERTEYVAPVRSLSLPLPHNTLFWFTRTSPLKSRTLGEHEVVPNLLYVLLGDLASAVI